MNNALTSITRFEKLLCLEMRIVDINGSRAHFTLREVKELLFNSAFATLVICFALLLTLLDFNKLIGRSSVGVAITVWHLCIIL